MGMYGMMMGTMRGRRSRPTGAGGMMAEMVPRARVANPPAANVSQSAPEENASSGGRSG